MKPTVVIGYPGFGDIEIEKEILRMIDAEVVHVAATDMPAAREAMRRADALIYGSDYSIWPDYRSLHELKDRTDIMPTLSVGELRKFTWDNGGRRQSRPKRRREPCLAGGLSI